MPATASGSAPFVAGVVLVRFSALGSFLASSPLAYANGSSRSSSWAAAPLLSSSLSPCSRLVPIRHARSHPGRQPERETSSAMSFNKVVRSVAFSLGSAFGGLMLAAGTTTGHSSPVDGA